MLERKEALASLPRGLEAESFDHPLAVVAIAEVAQGELQFFEVLEVPHPEELFIEGSLRVRKKRSMQTANIG